MSACMYVISSVISYVVKLCECSGGALVRSEFTVLWKETSFSLSVVAA